MILGKSTISTSNKFEKIDYNISIESCGYTSIISDTTEELAALESALYVADIILEEKALEGATEAELEVLLEGVMTSFFTRLKETIQKLLAKIKQWFANIKKFFQVLTSHGKDFAKKYKTDIMKAAARCNGFKYKTYRFEKGWRKIVEPEEVEESADVGVTETLAVVEALLAANPKKTNNEIIITFMQDKLWKDKSSSQAEFNKEFKERAYGGDLEREEFEDFESGSPSVTDMLYVLENGAKTMSLADKTARNLESGCRKLISEIEKQEKEAAKEAVKLGEDLSRKFGLAADLTRAVTNNALSCVDIYKEILKTAMKDAESILKSLLRHKPRKESFEPDLEDGSENVLESAFRFL